MNIGTGMIQETRFFHLASHLLDSVGDGFEPFIGILEVKVLSLEICKIGECWIFLPVHLYNMWILL